MRRAFQEQDWRKDPLLRALCGALLQCRTVDEVASFLRDVATLYEMEALSTRFEAARLITKRIPYREIVERTGLSSATVTRVAAFLKNGEGYKNVLKVSTHHHAHSPVGRGRHGSTRLSAGR